MHKAVVSTYQAPLAISYTNLKRWISRYSEAATLNRREIESWHVIITKNHRTSRQCTGTNAHSKTRPNAMSCARTCSIWRHVNVMGRRQFTGSWKKCGYETDVWRRWWGWWCATWAVAWPSSGWVCIVAKKWCLISIWKGWTWVMAVFWLAGW